MANIRRLLSGNWNVQVRLKGRRPLSKTFPTHDQALTWALQEEAENQVQRAIVAQRFLTLLDLGLSYAKAKLKDRQSYGKATMIAEQLGAAFPMTIDTITPRMVNEFKLHRLTQVSEETCRCQLAFLSRFYRYAIRELLIEVTNPVVGIAMPRASKPSDKVVSRAELDMLLAELNPTMALIVEIAYETAMRRAEIVKLTGSCLHLEDRIVDVIDGKTGSRPVPLTRRAVELLERAVSQSKAQENPSLRVFDIAPHSVSTAVARARKRAGLDATVRLHQLRHTRITEVARRGLNLMQIMAVSGHRDTRSVARYTHLNARDVLHLID